MDDAEHARNILPVVEKDRFEHLSPTQDVPCSHVLGLFRTVRDKDHPVAGGVLPDHPDCRK